MAVYKYVALKNGNEFVEGEMEASDLREARALVLKQGYTPTKIYMEDCEEQDFQETSSGVPAGNKISHLSLREKIDFTSSLETFISSGIPILEVLNSIEQDSASKNISVICHNVRKMIMTGKTFAQSLKQLYGKLFGNVYIALVQAGEDSGELEVTLGRILTILRKQEAIKDKLISASIYPAILIIMMFVLVFVFAKFVFPKLVGVTDFMGEELPYMGQLLYDACAFISNYWLGIIMFIAAGAFACKALLNISAIKERVDKLLFSLPVISDFIQYLNLSHYLTVLSVAYEAGVPILSCIEMACSTVGNSVMKKDLKKSITVMKSGSTLSDALRKCKVIPKALLSVISAGEKSGTMGKMLKDAADVADKKVDMAIDMMSRLFEPTIIIILGLVIGFALLAFVKTYYGILGGFC